MEKRRMICPDCGYIMMRKRIPKRKTPIRFECPNCEFAIELEPRQEKMGLDWQEFLQKVEKQWMEDKIKEAEEETRIEKEIASTFEIDIRLKVRKYRGKAVKEILRIICDTLTKEVLWHHSFRQTKIPQKEIDRLATIAKVILDSCFKVQNLIEGGDSG